MDEQRDWFLEVESTPGEEAVEIIGMMTEDLEYYINLIGKQSKAEEEKLLILKEVLPW